MTTSVIRTTDTAGVVRSSSPLSHAVTSDDLASETVRSDVRTSVVRRDGGLPGAPGPQNLYIQEAEPVMTALGLWIELNPDQSVKTMWVGSNAP